MTDKPPPAPPRLANADRRTRWLEAATLFGAVPFLIRLALPTRYLLPVLWVVSLIVYLALRRSRTFDPASLTTWNGWRREVRPMLLRFVLVAIVLIVALALHQPRLLFSLPVRNARLWLMVLTLYPFLSVFPQGLIYRAFFMHRYAVLFGGPATVRLAGALVFSFAHLPFGNPVALIFTFFGGLVFLATYQRTGSLLLAWLEHALYGNLLFTVGWGYFLYHGGTQALLLQG